MIGRVYRLIDTKRIEMKQREIAISEDIALVHPDYMAICAADQRYYFGQRRKEVLAQKLPMALIHEATGTVIKDFSGRYSENTKVVLLPLEEGADSQIKGNYREDSKFASSGVDGFMRDIVAIPADRLLPIDGGFTELYVFSEILSVAVGAVKTFEASRLTAAGVIGVWGDGSMGFVMALLLRCRYPEAKIYVFGKSVRKLSKFSFVNGKYYIDNIPAEITVDHAFECVGDKKSEAAIEQIIGMIAPQGTISLLGVSENAVAIDTRQTLGKGLMLIGNSRSDRQDFEEAIRLIRDNEICREYIKLLISEIVEIKKDDDIPYVFEQDALNDFKTVVKWSL